MKLPEILLPEAQIAVDLQARERDLEVLFEKAAADPLLRAEFMRELLKANLYLRVADPHEYPRPLGPKAETVGIALIESEGAQHLAVFTSLAKARELAMAREQTAERFVRLPAEDIFRMLEDGTFLRKGTTVEITLEQPVMLHLNFGFVPSKAFSVEEARRLLAGEPEFESYIAPQGTHYFPPRDPEPARNVEAILRPILIRTRSVDRAWLAEMPPHPDSPKPCYLAILNVRGDIEKTMAEIAHMFPDKRVFWRYLYILDFMPLSDGKGMATWPPFYVRSFWRRWF